MQTKVNEVVTPPPENKPKLQEVNLPDGSTVQAHMLHVFAPHPYVPGQMLARRLAPLIAEDVCPVCKTKLLDYGDEVLADADGRLVCPNCMSLVQSRAIAKIRHFAVKQATGQVMVSPAPRILTPNM